MDVGQFWAKQLLDMKLDYIMMENKEIITMTGAVTILQFSYVVLFGLGII